MFPSASPIVQARGSHGQERVLRRKAEWRWARDPKKAQPPILGLLVVATLAGASPVLAGRSAPSERTTPAPVEAKVLRHLKAKHKTAFWISFRDHAELSRAYRSPTGAAVASSSTNASTQSPFAARVRRRALLRARHTSYRSFWIVNAMYVPSGDRKLVDVLAVLPEVSAIRAPHVYRISQPVKPRRAPAQPTTPTWGLWAINVPEVWSNLRRPGEGIVVANIDSGVKWNHEALYLTIGAGTAST